MKKEQNPINTITLIKTMIAKTHNFPIKYECPWVEFLLKKLSEGRKRRVSEIKKEKEKEKETWGWRRILAPESVPPVRLSGFGLNRRNHSAYTFAFLQFFQLPFALLRFLMRRHGPQDRRLEWELGKEIKFSKCVVGFGLGLGGRQEIEGIWSFLLSFNWSSHLITF